MIPEFFNYEFIRFALAASLLSSITAGIIGTYVVTRRMVFITGGITHASFGGLGLGFFLGINPLIGAALFGVASGIGVEYLSRFRKIREDSVIAMMWSFGMAIGIIFISLAPGYAPNLMSYLFGNILSVSTGDILIMSILMVLVLALFIPFFRLIQYLTFDEEFAQTSRVPVSLFKYLLAGLVALTAVVYIRVAGIILVLSLLTIPQNIALLFSNNLKKIMFLSIGIGFLGSLLGLIFSYAGNIPSGASIIFCLVLLYLVASAGKGILSSRKTAHQHS
ncbi:MAG: metal ABC transporter permease [Bacteroidales bacterium]|nr:metal ABC transporter permease [Bacteroidales bacterium]